MTAAATLVDGPDTPRAAARVGPIGRTLLAAACVPVSFVGLLPAWTAWEAAAAGRLAARATDVDVTRHGASLTATGDHGTLALFVVGWCSSLGPVLAVVALGWVLRGPVRRRVRTVAAAVALLVVANVVRLAALVWWGVSVDPGSVDRVHDGIGTAFSVVVVLLAAAIVLLPPRRARRDDGPRRDDGAAPSIRP